MTKVTPQHYDKHELGQQVVRKLKTEFAGMGDVPADLRQAVNDLMGGTASAATVQRLIDYTTGGCDARI